MSDLRIALMKIRDLHKKVEGYPFCSHCHEDGGYDGALPVMFPCETRKLADEALNNAQICKDCDGLGSVMGESTEDPRWVPCFTCDGSGLISSKP